MDWQDRLWQSVTPHLPAGRVGLWVVPACRPTQWVMPVTTLPSWHDPAEPTPPAGAALQGLLVLACGQATLPWPTLLAQLPPLLAPQAPLLMLIPRGGLIGLRQPSWANRRSYGRWQRDLYDAGWQVQQKALLGGTSWPGPWATAALRLLICQPHGMVPPRRIQFSSKRGGTAPANGWVA